MNVEMNENAKRYIKKAPYFFFSFLNLFVCYSVKEVWKVLDTKVLGNTFLLLEILSLSTSAAVKSESRKYNFETSSDLVPLNLLRNLESILMNLEKPLILLYNFFFQSISGFACSIYNAK